VSAVGTNGDRLTGTILSNAQGPTHTGLYAGWIKATATPGGSNFAIQLFPSSEGSFITLELRSSGGEKGFGSGQWGGSGGNSAASASAITQNVWQHHAVFFDADAGFPNVYHYFNGTRATAGTSSPLTATQALDRLTLLDGGNLNAYTYLKGKFAEACGFRGASLSEADAIVTSLQTLTPDAVSLPGGVALIFHYPLLSDAAGTAGPTLSDTGTVVYDSGDHPSLSGGGGGGSSAGFLLLTMDDEH